MSELEEFFKTMGRTQKAWEEFERLRQIEQAAREVVRVPKDVYDGPTLEVKLDALRAALAPSRGGGGE